MSLLQLPARRVGPLASILIRVGIALAALLSVATITYIERDGYRDVVNEVSDVEGASPEFTYLDALYYATVSLSTTGYGDITPVSDTARFVNVFVITPLRILFLVVLVGTTVEVLTKRSRDELRATRWRNRVKDHTVVVGYGVKGRSSVRAIIDQGTAPGDIVVVDATQEALDEATAIGCVAVVGDATREDVLRLAEISRAARIVVATDRDDTSVLVVLTARRLNSSATIVASARESQNIIVLRQSGANIVIPTAEASGRMLGLSLQSHVAGQIVEDLLEPVEGLEIVEREITPAELGVPPESLISEQTVVLAVVRDGEVHRFDEGRVSLLQRGDRIVVIRPSGRATRAEA
ncbi:MAG: potassium channel family protein [Actinobacteria bacterium]|jgi:voltage-gated potassium channel|nr:potassium channel family protein [Actinomycetota bacterium]